LPQIYRTGTVFVITSKTETQSIVLMEAMASGLPAIAVNAGAVTELVKDGENGFIFEPDDTAGIASGINTIISNKELREKMSKNALKMIAKHDINYTLSRFEKIYNNVLRSRSKQLG